MRKYRIHGLHNRTGEWVDLGIIDSLSKEMLLESIKGDNLFYTWTHVFSTDKFDAYKVE